jgi:uncharacterized protein YkwD
MLRFRMLLAASSIAGFLALTAPTEAGPRRSMVRTISHARTWAHVHGVRFSRRLSHGAAAWARHLMQTGSLAHSARAVRRGEGEIIEWHTGGSAQVRGVVHEWLSSPGHRRVLLKYGYRRAGAGRVVGVFGGQRSTIWVVRFAR